MSGPAGCRFSWCVTRAAGHTTHLSAPVEVWHSQGCVLFAETDPDTGAVLYGPVLGTGESDEPVGQARVIAARLRTAAARLDELAIDVALTDPDMDEALRLVQQGRCQR